MLADMSVKCSKCADFVACVFSRFLTNVKLGLANIPWFSESGSEIFKPEFTHANFTKGKSCISLS